MAQKMLGFARKAMQAMVERKGFDRVMEKINIIEGYNGRVVAELKVDHDHSNALDVIHGGMVATAMDCISGLCMGTLTEGAPMMTVSMNITFMRPAPVGSTILIEGTTIKKGKTLGFINVDVMDKDTRKMLAQAKNTFYLLGT